MFRTLSLCLLLTAAAAQAALITQHADTDLQSPVLDGVISANEYGPGNSFSYAGGGSGFGGQLGPATLYMKSDATNLYLGFSGLGTPADGNRYIAYFHTRAGGFQPNGEMSDVSDGGRSNVSFLSSGGTESLTFEQGVSNKPDFAMFFYNNSTGFSACVELRGAGQAHVVVPRVHAALGTGSPEFRIPRAALGLAVSGTVDFAAVEVSPSGFLSNEGVPATGLGSNPGFAAGVTTILRDFHRFDVTSLLWPLGLTQRVANTTLRMPSSLPAESTNSYTTSNAFPGLTLVQPVALATPPGETNRLFIVEQPGRIMVITNLGNPTLTTFLNITGKCAGSTGEGGLLGLAFHPGYATNRYFYVFYTATGAGFANRLARYQTQAGNPNAADTNSETVLFGQYDDQSNHNGGDLHFGPDGYLYVSTGDEGGCNGNQGNAQTINRDLFSAILRLDVDKRPGSLAPNHHAALAGVTNYAIPPDNPFVGVTSFHGTNIAATSVRTEFWAIGMRNPFRMSFDEITGDLYAGDVGQDTREEVDLIVKGGNYAWNYREGSVLTPVDGCGVAIPPAPAGFTVFVDPICDYQRGGGQTNGNVITGGRVYRGDRFPDLYGQYIFCDYGSGNMWRLTPNGTNRVSFTHMLTDDNISAFGRDPRNGDLLMCDLTAGQVKRLERITATNALPADLADTGAFADLPTLTPFPGIVPYDLNVPFWSDGAIKSRWFSLPSTNLHMAFTADGLWGFPTSMVWIKHFDLLLTSGVPASARRMETRFLVKNADGAGGYGVTYRWGLSLTNAALVPSVGLDEPVVINDAGIIRTQTWHYPSRGECLVCHQSSASFALGFSTRQLHRDYAYAPSDVTNQIRRLSDMGYLDTNVPSVHRLRALAHPTNAAYSLEYRARSYLQANCSHCHYPGGPTPAAFDTRIVTPLSEADILNGGLANTMGDPSNRVVRPGAPTNSMVYRRISVRGATQMPPLASFVVDTQGVALITAWINAISNYQGFAEWQLANFGSTNATGTGADEDYDGDGTLNGLEYLTRKEPTNAASFWSHAGVGAAGGVPLVIFERTENVGFEVYASSNLLDGTWSFLDLPANAPLVSGSSSTQTVQDVTATNDPARFYRIHVYEP